MIAHQNLSYPFQTVLSTSCLLVSSAIELMCDVFTLCSWSVAICSKELILGIVGVGGVIHIFVQNGFLTNWLLYGNTNFVPTMKWMVTHE